MTGAATGRFITLEGGEGAGKSTQARRLKSLLDARGIEAVVTREPGGTPGAEEIRKLLVAGATARWTPMAEALLHSAARAEHIARVIEPALAAGRWVICDRFIDSTLAYQGYGQGLDLDAVGALNRLVAGAHMPQLTLVLDLPPEAGLARVGGRDGTRAGGEDRYERMDGGFHQRMRDGFLAIAEAAPERCAVIDASGDEDSVAAAIAAVVADRLGLP